MQQGRRVDATVQILRSLLVVEVTGARRDRTLARQARLRRSVGSPRPHRRTGNSRRSMPGARTVSRHARHRGESASAGTRQSLHRGATSRCEPDSSQLGREHRRHRAVVESEPLGRSAAQDEFQEYPDFPRHYRAMKFPAVSRRRMVLAGRLAAVHRLVDAGRRGNRGRTGWPRRRTASR